MCGMEVRCHGPRNTFLLVLIASGFTGMVIRQPVSVEPRKRKRRQGSGGILFRWSSLRGKPKTKGIRNEHDTTPNAWAGLRTVVAFHAVLGACAGSAIHADRSGPPSRGGYSFASGINDAGQVVGSAFLPGQPVGYATLWNGTTAIQLGPTGTSSVAQAINSAGQVVGEINNNNATLAIVWNGATATTLGTLGGTGGFAYGINNTGQVGGYSNTAGNAAEHATLWNGTTATDLATLGGPNSVANGINSAGQVVGYAGTPGDAADDATLWAGGKIIDLNSELTRSLGNNVTLTRAVAINDNGQIAADGSNGEAYLLTPTPVPLPARSGCSFLDWEAWQRWGDAGAPPKLKLSSLCGAIAVIYQNMAGCVLRYLSCSDYYAVISTRLPANAFKFGDRGSRTRRWMVDTLGSEGEAVALPPSSLDPQQQLIEIARRVCVSRQ
jgi:probable HAF family extracellular repeat protein